MVKPRVVRVCEFVAESLETEASFIPDGDKSRKDALLNMAKVMRDSTNPRTVRVWEEQPNSTAKKYLLVGPPISTGTTGHYVLNSKMAIEWVEDPHKAYADYEQPIKRTQEDLAALGIRTEVEEVTFGRQPPKMGSAQLGLNP